MPGRWGEFRSQDSDTQQAWVQIPFHHWEGRVTLGTCANFPPGKTDNSLCMRLLPGRVGSPGRIEHFSACIDEDTVKRAERRQLSDPLPTHTPTHPWAASSSKGRAREMTSHIALYTSAHLSEGKPGIYRNNVGLHVGLNMGKTGKKLSRDMDLG